MRIYIWTHLVPVLVRELLAWVPALDAGAVDENLWLQALTGDCGDDAFDGLPIPQFGDVNPGLPTEAGDFIFGGGVGGVSLRGVSWVF